MLHLLKSPSRQKALAPNESPELCTFFAEMHFGKCNAALIKIIGLLKRANVTANPLMLFIQFDSVARTDSVRFVDVWQ